MRRTMIAGWLLGLTLVAAHAQSNDFVTVAPQPSHYAWWLRATFRPFGREIRGIPVGAVRPTWCKATEFRRGLLPSELAKDVAESGLSFAVQGSFDGSKKPQTALVGAYETCNGKRGSFLLVLAEQPGHAPAVRFVHEMPDVPFGAVRARGRVINLFHCLECDDVTSVAWNPAKRRFRILDPDD